MMHKAWSRIEEVPYCFSRSSVKLQSHTALKIVELDPHWAFPDCNSSLNSPMATKWCIELEVASYVKFQGHTALKIVEFDPNWAFPDCNSSLNSPMAMKCCTKLETAKERCPVVFQGHPSNFKVTRYKTSPILTQIGRFRTIGRSQLSNPSDLPCFSTYVCLYWIKAILCGYATRSDRHPGRGRWLHSGCLPGRNHKVFLLYDTSIHRVICISWITSR